MIPAGFEYRAPSSIAETISLLQAHGSDAKIISGGQSLIPMMRFRMISPQVLIDIGRIPGLDLLVEEDGYLRIGASVRTSTLEHSSLIARRYPLLATAAQVIADPIVRNRGTVVGSIVHADPAGDWAATMVAARAQVVVEGPDGQRVIAIEDFLVDTFTSALAEAEVAIEVRVPMPGPHAGGAYHKIERKVGDFATAAVAVQIQMGDDGRCKSAGIGLCAVGLITLRAAAAEAALLGQPLTESVIAKVAALAAEGCEPSSDTRGPADYKRDMVRVLTIRALKQAGAVAQDN